MELVTYIHIKCETGEVSKPLRADKARFFYLANPEETAVLRVDDPRVRFSEARHYHPVGHVTPGECPPELR